jgi:RecB family exonuclease
VAGGLTAITPDAVRPRPLERISPSLGEALLECELRAAYRLDPRYRQLQRPTPASALGTISHELAKEVANGRFDSVPAVGLDDALEAAWTTKLAAAERELSAAHPEGALPPPARWKGYQQTRVRVLQLLRKEVMSRQAGGRGSQPLALEVALEPEGIPLHGRADRVERHGGEVELVDLKTGWTLPDELRPTHRRQLLAYAFLWHAVNGEWPQTASIQRLDGRRLSFDVDPAEAEAVAAELVGALDRYNEQVAAGVQPAALARPSNVACRYCAYRPACSPFFAALDESWEWHLKSLLGVVEGSSIGREMARVDVALWAGNLEGGRASLLNVPPSTAPDLGSIVAVVDAAPTRVAGDLRLTWSSTICVWPAGSARPRHSA